MNGMVDFSELVKRIFKYLILGIVIALVAIVIPKQRLRLEEVIILALMAAATFSILDVFAPSIAESTRNGLGMGLGVNLMGGLRLAA
jgi:ABC-type Co2+ transport system permease subunit